MKYRNLIITRKKNGNINQIKMRLSEEDVEKLGDNLIKIEFNGDNKEIFFERINSSLEKEMKVEKGSLVSFIGSYKIQKKDRQLSIPGKILKEFNYPKKMNCYYKGNKLILKAIEGEDPNMKKNGKIITIKVNKGGVGKTFTTVQLGSKLALEGKKTLLLTSDSQNNILDYTLGYEHKVDFKKGLKEWVKGNASELIKLRDNLYFIPLESNTFSTTFLKNLPCFLNEVKKEYDYILIDSIPTMKLDSVFVGVSDSIILPCFCDGVTVDGVINVIEEAGVEKVHGILINKYNNKKIQTLFLNKIEKAIKGTDIICPPPIKNSSLIEELLFKGKTIWESSSKNLLEAKLSFELILAGLENDIEEKSEDDFEIDF